MASRCPAWRASASCLGPFTSRELFQLVSDFHGRLGQGRRVLPVVMRAEQQFPAAGKDGPDISLGAAAVATVPPIDRLGGAWCSTRARFS